MNRLPLIFACILISFNAFTQKIADEVSDKIPNEIIVSTQETNRELLKSVKAINKEINYVELKPLCKALDIYLLIMDTYDGSDVGDQVISHLETNHDIEYAYYNQITQQRATPTDTRYPNQWNLELIRAEEAWDLTKGGVDFNGNEIVIAVLDDGFDIDHEDIQNNLWVNPNDPIGGGDDDFNGYVDDIHGIDLNSGNGNIVSKSHGTAVMGIVGADSDNELGITGINWDSKIMVLSSVTNVAKVIEGYDYVYQMRNLHNLSNGANGAFVVATNYSLGIDKEFGVDNPGWCNMYDLLGSVGIVSVGATTNSNRNVDTEGDLPSTCESSYFIGVTNTDRNDVKVTNAGFGLEHIDLSAPGRNAESFKENSAYGTFGGTSASAPHVAGALGLLYSLKCENFAAFINESPGEAALRIRQAILNGTDALPTLNGITATGGRLNILKSMSDLAEYCSTDTNLVVSGTLNIDFIREDNNGLYTVFYKSPNTRPVTLTIYDVLGRKIYTSSSNPGLFSRSNERIDLNRMTSGIYIATITLDDDIVSRKFRHFSN